jgi:hypothetical protein
MWITYNFKGYQTWELNTKPLASSNEALPLDQLNFLLKFYIFIYINLLGFAIFIFLNNNNNV